MLKQAATVVKGEKPFGRPAISSWTPGCTYRHNRGYTGVMARTNIDLDEELVERAERICRLRANARPGSGAAPPCGAGDEPRGGARGHGVGRRPHRDPAPRRRPRATNLVDTSAWVEYLRRPAALFVAESGTCWRARLRSRRAKLSWTYWSTKHPVVGPCLPCPAARERPTDTLRAGSDRLENHNLLLTHVLDLPRCPGLERTSQSSPTRNASSFRHVWTFPQWGHVALSSSRSADSNGVCSISRPV